MTTTQNSPTPQEKIPYELVTATIRRLHADGLHREATLFARRAAGQTTAEGVRALVRGYYSDAS